MTVVMNILCAVVGAGLGVFLMADHLPFGYTGTHRTGRGEMSTYDIGRWYAVEQAAKVAADRRDRAPWRAVLSHTPLPQPPRRLALDWRKDSGPIPLVRIGERELVEVAT